MGIGEVLLTRILIVNSNTNSYTTRRMWFRKNLSGEAA
jgi:hypothetical protein